MSWNPPRWRLLLPLVASFLAACVVGYLLWRDFQEDAGIGHGVQVARLQSHVGEVKRRPSDRFRWFSVRINKQIYEGDSLRTGPQSRLELAFPDGSAVQIAENTLITIEKRSHDEVAVQLLNGSVSFQSASAPSPGTHRSALRIESQGKTLDIAGAKGRVSATENRVAVDVASGTASLRNGGQVRNVEVGKVLEASSDGSMQIGDSRYELIFPGQDSVLRVAPTDTSRQIEFRWKQPGKNSLVLEISSELNFSVPWQSLNTSGDTARLSLPAGKYSWRLRSNGGMTSPSSSFEILPNAGVGLLEPVPGMTFEKRGEGDSVKVPFSWRQDSKSSVYRLLIAREPDFKQIVSDERIESAALPHVLGLPDSGRYFWKVEGSDADGVMLKESEVREFTIMTRAEPSSQPAPIALPLPVVAVTKAPTGGSDAPEKRDLTTGGLDFQLTWEPVANASSYRLIFGRDPELRKVLLERIPKENSIILSGTEFGPKTWYFRAVAKTREGQTATSPVGEMDFRFLGPTLASPTDQMVLSRRDVEQEKGVILFTWEVAGAPWYLIEIASDREFTRIVTESFIKSNFFASAPLLPGSYWWRVRAVRPPLVSEFSAVRGLRIGR